MKRTRRNHTAVFKAKVALAAIKGEKTLAELSTQYDVHVNQITQWKSELVSRSTEIFTTAAERKEVAGGPDLGSLHAKIVSISVQYFPLVSVQYFPLFLFAEGGFCAA
ncbi:MAG: transposase [Glaciimonas sp.]|nr:transposase [Glaciimonas sp.]